MSISIPITPYPLLRAQGKLTSIGARCSRVRQSRLCKTSPEKGSESSELISSHLTLEGNTALVLLQSLHLHLLGPVSLSSLCLSTPQGECPSASLSVESPEPGMKASLPLIERVSPSSSGSTQGSPLVHLFHPKGQQYCTSLIPPTPRIGSSLLFFVSQCLARQCLRGQPR